MADIDTVFNALLFGSGSWIGLIIIVCFLVFLAKTTEYIGKVIGIPICAFLAIEYLGQTETNAYLAWHALIMFILACFVVFDLFREMKK